MTAKKRVAVMTTLYLFYFFTIDLIVPVSG